MTTMKRCYLRVPGIADCAMRARSPTIFCMDVNAPVPGPTMITGRLSSSGRRKYLLGLT